MSRTYEPSGYGDDDDVSVYDFDEGLNDGDE